MTFWVIVDVFIGLILVYLLLGMIATSLQEALAAWLNLRGECLRSGLKTLLAHGAAGSMGIDWLYSRVSSHSLIQPSGTDRHPSYVAASNFATALVDGLRDGSQSPLFSQVEASVAKLPPGSAKQALTALLVRAGGDLDLLQTSIEKWFDDAMDRVSGIYKRLANNCMLAFGVVVALLGNIDTIEIALALQRDPVLLQTMVAKAQEISKGAVPAAAASAASVSAVSASAATSAASAASAPAASLAEVRRQVQELADLNLPMGWTPAKFAALMNPLQLVGKLFGLLITALAVSLGAPFWFDLLQNVLNLRTAGPKPARADG
jgi:hypothetical protein